jgi:ADP-ribose pyrophosphatase YjhB (NUDIX family)
MDLPKKRVGASALIFNDAGEILIVKTSYKSYWSLPGGIAEHNESPSSACRREVREEVGIDMVMARCLCVHWQTATADNNESVRFMFFGGIVDGEVVIKDTDEISECRFSTVKDALKLLSETSNRMVSVSLKALQANGMFYFEDGEDLT